jgi:hypothetical protein
MTQRVNTEKPTIGADPELFVVNIDGKFISAIGKIGGSKKKPRPIGLGCYVQEDNVAVEFNIPPAVEADKFVKSCEYVLEYLAREVAEKGLFLRIAASKSFDEDQLRHVKAHVFGCEPDFNAWTGAENPKPESMDKALRSAGGHVHIGTELNKLQVGRWCDVLLGLPSILEDPDLRRRELYGRAGAYRPKLKDRHGFEGIEYRVLSNYWLQNDAMMKATFDRATEAVERVQFGYTLDDKDGDAIQQAINTSNKFLADSLMGRFGAP